MLPELLYLSGLVLSCLGLAAAVYAITVAVKEKKKAKATPVCKVNDGDCFARSDLCPNGYCLVHCVCNCRGSHKGT